MAFPPDAYIFAVPKLDVSEVATNAKTFVALAVAPELTFNMSEVVKSDMVSVPASTLKVSAPAPPDSSSFSAPPVRLSFPPPPYRRSKPPSEVIISLPVPPLRISTPAPPVMVNPSL